MLIDGRNFYDQPNSDQIKKYVEVRKVANEFYGMLQTNSQVCTVLEKSKETVTEFYKETAKVL